MEKSDSRRTGPPAPCVCCGKVGPIMARGLREKCWWRMRRSSELENFPLTRSQAEYTLEKGFYLDRAEQYRQLTTGVGALGRNAACRVLGISTRTGYRYEAMFRASGQEQAESGGKE